MPCVIISPSRKTRGLQLAVIRATFPSKTPFQICASPLSLCLMGDALCRNPASMGRRRTARGHSTVLDIVCVSLSGQSPRLLGNAACPQGFQQHTARVCHERGRAGRWGTVQGASRCCPPPGTEAALRQLCSPQRSASASMI